MKAPVSGLSGTAPGAFPSGSDPLEALRDWHPPEPVSWWPPALGWWLVGGLGLTLLLLALGWWWQRRRRAAPARAALVELRALRSGFASQPDHRRQAAAVSALLRRLALVRYPRHQVAGLAGREWLAFLDRTGGAGGFTQGPGRALTEAPYRPGQPSGSPIGSDPGTVWEPAGLLDLADRWIRAHWDPRP